MLGYNGIWRAGLCRARRKGLARRARRLCPSLALASICQQHQPDVPSGGRVAFGGRVGLRAAHCPGRLTMYIYIYIYGSGRLTFFRGVLGCENSLSNPGPMGCRSRRKTNKFVIFCAGGQSAGRTALPITVSPEPSRPGATARRQSYLRKTT